MSNARLNSEKKCIWHHLQHFLTIPPIFATFSYFEINFLILPGRKSSSPFHFHYKEGAKACVWQILKLPISVLCIEYCVSFSTFVFRIPAYYVEINVKNVSLCRNPLSYSAAFDLYVYSRALTCFILLFVSL